MRHLLAILLLLSCGRSAGQTAAASPRRDTRPFHDRIWFGGGVGVNFGTVTAIQLDPLVGYKIDTDGRASAGLGISYWYYRDNRFKPAIDLSGYGYRTFARYRVIDPVFLHAEFLNLNVERYNFADGLTTRLWVPHLLVGGGYVQSMGGRSSVYMQVLWEVLQNPNSVYLNQGPIISVGFGMGF
jgi:hypothetical protein